MSNSGYPGPYSGAQIDAGIARGLIAARQYTTMPAVTNGAIVQYVGETTATYTNGHFYKGVSGAWTEVEFGEANTPGFSATGAPTGSNKGIDLHFASGVLDGLAIGGASAAASGSVVVADGLKALLLGAIDAAGVETGTWTPALYDASTTLIGSYPNAGTYVKIGSVYFISLVMALTEGSFPTSISIRGLPKAVKRGNNTYLAYKFQTGPYLSALAVGTGSTTLYVRDTSFVDISGTFAAGGTIALQTITW